MHPAEAQQSIVATPGTLFLSEQSSGKTKVISTLTSNRYTIRSRGRDKSHKVSPDAKGWRAPSPYYGYTALSTTGSVSGLQNYSPYLRFLVDNYPVFGPWNAYSTSVEFPQKDADSAYQRALLKFKHRHLNLAVTVAEIGETRRMLRATILKIVELLVMIRRPRQMWRTIRRDFDPVSLWLQARYGWIPLLSDLKGAVESLDYHMGEKPPKLTVRARNIVTRTTDTKQPDLMPWLSHIVAKVTATEELGVMVRVRMDADVLDQRVLNLVDTGIQDPLLVAWELVPLSFVVDWFVGIGNYLDGLNALAGLSYRGGSSTAYRTLRRSLRIDNVTVGQVTQWVPPTQYITRFDRTVVVVPVSKLVVNGFDRMNAVHWLDAISLLKQQFQRLLRRR